MNGQGIKARTDRDETVGIVWSGRAWEHRPCVPAAECSSEAAKQSAHNDVFRAAQRAAVRGSDRARVLLENYRHSIR